MSDVTCLLNAAASGEQQAVAALLPLVYDELRKLAAARMAAENPGHTLDATALVHEAYLRLTRIQSFQSRSHFLRAAAEAMRRILVDHARARNAAKRGAGRRSSIESPAAPVPDESLVALNESLSRLALDYRMLAVFVQLRFFGELTLSQAAEILGVSAQTTSTCGGNTPDG